MTQPANVTTRLRQSSFAPHIALILVQIMCGDPIGPKPSHPPSRDKPKAAAWDNPAVANLVRQNYVAARRAGIFGQTAVTYDGSRQLGPNGCNSCPPDRYQLEASVVSNSTSVETLTGYVDQAMLIIRF